MGTCKSLRSVLTPGKGKGGELSNLGSARHFFMERSFEPSVFYCIVTVCSCSSSSTSTGQVDSFPLHRKQDSLSLLHLGFAVDCIHMGCLVCLCLCFFPSIKRNNICLLSKTMLSCKKEETWEKIKVLIITFLFSILHFMQCFIDLMLPYCWLKGFQWRVPRRKFTQSTKYIN